MKVALLEQIHLFGDQDKIQADFEEFHHNNPNIYRKFCELAFEAIESGEKVGSKLIIEVLRWKLKVKTKDKSGFKINNNYSSRYAWKFMQDHPQHEGYFTTKRRTIDI